jgi:hypothetical protein
MTTFTSGSVTTFTLAAYYYLSLDASISASGASIDAAGMNPLQQPFGSAPPIGAFPAMT